MIDYQVSLQKAAIAKANEQDVITRQEVYFPQIVGVRKMDVFELVDAILNMGSTAFTKGEWTGVAIDLGSAIAQQLINGYKVYIDGLGTFEPVLNSKQSNIKDPSKINSSNFRCSAKFTPDSKFLTVLAGVNWNRKELTEASSSSSASVTYRFVAQTNNSNLKFVTSDSAYSAALSGQTVTATVNGNAASSVTATNEGIFINNVINTGNSLTNATITISLPSVTVGTGAEAVTYSAQTLTINGVSQTGPVNNDPINDGND